MPMATMTSKGQVTIPKEVRDQLHLKPHDKLTVTIDGNRAVLQPLHGDILGMRGIFHRKGLKPINFRKLREEFEKSSAERVVKILERSRSR